MNKLISILLLFYSISNPLMSCKKDRILDQVKLGNSRNTFILDSIPDFHDQLAAEFYNLDLKFFDSLEIDNILPSTFQIDTSCGSDLHACTLKITKGSLFDTALVHLIFTEIEDGHKVILYVRNRFEPNFEYKNFYIESDKQFIKDFEESTENINILNDTIMDVNGDGFSDFVLYVSSPTGCCLRDVARVYLYMPIQGMFTHYFEFMNPTFFPKEKMVRGVGYGSPGEVELYEQKWNGLNLLDLQKIRPNFRDTLHKTFIVYNKDNDFTSRKNKVIKKLPSTFLKINYLDYFLDYDPNDFADREFE